MSRVFAPEYRLIFEVMYTFKNEREVKKCEVVTNMCQFNDKKLAIFAVGLRKEVVS